MLEVWKSSEFPPPPSSSPPRPLLHCLSSSSSLSVSLSPSDWVWFARGKLVSMISVVTALAQSTPLNLKRSLASGRRWSERGTLELQSGAARRLFLFTYLFTLTRFARRDLRRLHAELYDPGWMFSTAVETPSFCFVLLFFFYIFSPSCRFP